MDNVHNASILPPQNKNFTGRQKQMKELCRLLQPDQAGDRFAHSQQIIKLWGLPGVGKSQLALEYAHRHHDQYQLFYWIRCGNDTVVNYMKRLARDLDINVENISDMNVVSRVYDFLKTLDSYLLVFDHVDSDISKYLPPEDLLKPKQHVIITTHSAEGGHKPFELGEFSSEDACNYVSSRLHTDNHHDADNEIEIKNLCDALGYLPLALSQAVAFIKKCKFDIKTYVDDFKTVRTKMMKQNITFDNHCKHSVFLTLLKAIEKVVGKDPLYEPTYGPDENAPTLLKCFSVLDSEDIPLWLFKQSHLFPDPDTSKLLDAVHKLRDYALIAKSTKPGEHYRIHKLVQHVIREYKEQDLRDSLPGHFAEKLLRPLTDAIVKVLPEGFERCGWKDINSDSLEKLRTLVPHIHTLLRHIDNALVAQRSLSASEEHSYVAALHELIKCKSELLKVAGYSAYYRRDFSEGVLFFRRLVEVLENELSSEKNVSKPTALQMLGTCLLRVPDSHEEAMGCFDEALELLGESLPRQKITIIAAKAKNCLFVGKYIEAEKLLRDALQLQQKYLPNDEDLLSYILPKLGNIAYYKGLYEEAKKHFGKCLSIRRKHLKQEDKSHILIAVCEFALAKTLMSLGVYKESEEKFMHCLDTAILHLGDKHAYVGKVYGAIGKCLILQTRYQHASEYLTHALENFKRNYGEGSKIYVVIDGWLLYAKGQRDKPFEDDKQLLLLGF